MGIDTGTSVVALYGLSVVAVLWGITRDKELADSMSVGAIIAVALLWPLVSLAATMVGVFQLLGDATGLRRV